MPTATPARLEVNRAWLAMAGPSAYGGSMPGEVTQALQAVERGDPRAADELLPLVYEEFRRLEPGRSCPGARRFPGDGQTPMGLRPVVVAVRTAAVLTDAASRPPSDAFTQCFFVRLSRLTPGPRH
jgi:hypothetical protein